ncbi:MAG: cytotoxic translational repressor of toxin-antitoxin stability system [Opitutales bacterium]|nr:cytotoxic translational repressor of toxin-antitoxin stability system [Opitutales bacterium]
MFQVIFSDQCMGELNKMDKLSQLEIMDVLSSVNADDLLNDKCPNIGKVRRSGKEFYRLRAGEYRIYFEIKDGKIFANWALHQHTIADFVFRFKLPFKEETLVEQEDNFWKYIDSLKK